MSETTKTWAQCVAKGHSLLVKDEVMRRLAEQMRVLSRPMGLSLGAMRLILQKLLDAPTRECEHG